MNLVQPRAAYGGTLCLFPPPPPLQREQGLGVMSSPCASPPSVYSAPNPPPPEAFPLPPSRAVASPCPLCPAWGHSFLLWAGQGRVAHRHCEVAEIASTSPPPSFPPCHGAATMLGTVPSHAATSCIPCARCLKSQEGGGHRQRCCLRLIYCHRPHPSGPSPPPHQAPSPRGFRRGPSPGRGRGLSGGGIRPYLASLRRRWMSGSIWAVGRRGL